MRKGYIGLDVHKEFIAISVALTGREEPVYYGKCSSDIERLVGAIRKLLKKHRLLKGEVQLCYEAGPCGFVLARHLLRMGYLIEIVAPSLIPVRKGDSIKTDKRDASKLARLLRAGELTSVHIPDSSDEVIRDLCRARTDAVDEQTRNRQRLTAFLLRNGHRYTGRSTWTEAHVRFLRELVLQDPLQKIILEDYLQAVDSSIERVARIEEQMRTCLCSWKRRPYVEALMSFRGIRMITAMITASELGDLRRFTHPGQLMAYLGLVPSEESSGGRRRQGSITKCGNSHVRWVLVESAHHHRIAPKISKELSRRQEGQSREIKALSWKVQGRLHKRYVHLAMRQLHANKIKVAVARELCSYIWDLYHIVEDSQAA